MSNFQDPKINGHSEVEIARALVEGTIGGDPDSEWARSVIKESSPEKVEEVRRALDAGDSFGMSFRESFYGI